MSSKEWNEKENKAATVMIPLREVRRALYQDPCMSKFISDFDSAIYPFMKSFYTARNQAKIAEEVLSDVNADHSCVYNPHDYYREWLDSIDAIGTNSTDRKKHQVAVVACVCFFALNSWLKNAVSSTMTRKGAIAGETGARAFVSDNARDYELMAEISSNCGFTGPDDVARDIILASYEWTNRVYTCTLTGAVDTPYNALIRQYRALSKELHARHNVPSLSLDDDENEEGASLDLERILFEAEAIVESEGRQRDIELGYTSPQQALVEINHDLVAYLYPRKRDTTNQDDYTFLVDCGGYYALDYSAIRARIAYLNRTKSGRGAIAALESQLGYSRENRGSLMKEGRATGARANTVKSHTGGSRRQLTEYENVSIALSSPMGMDRAKKGNVGTTKKTVVERVLTEIAPNGATQVTRSKVGRPKKRKPGRPKGSIKVAQ